MLTLLLSAILLAPAPVTAPLASAPFTAPTSWLRGVWTDGDTLLAVIGEGVVDLSCRTGERTRLTGAWGLRAVAGATIDGKPMIAAVTEHGELLRWRAGSWSLSDVPRNTADPLLAIAVDARGHVFVLGEKRAVYRLDGERWSEVSYPPEMSRAVGFTVGDNDEIFVLGDEGELLRGNFGSMRALALRGLPEATRRAWLAPGGVLWLAGLRELASVDLDRSGAGMPVPTLQFGAVRALTGVSTPQGPLLAFAAQSTLALYDGKRVTRLAAEVVFPEGITLDLHGSALLVASRDGLTTLPIDHPALQVLRAGLEPESNCPLAPGVQTKALGDLRPVPKASPPPPPPERSPRFASPAEPRVPKLERPALAVRVGLGPTIVPGETPGPRVRAGFNLDLALGVVVNPRQHVYLWPELGYSYNLRAGQAGHFFIAGLTPTFGSEYAQVGVAARLVAGDAWGAAGVGLRSGVVGSFARHALSIELGHQWLRAGHRDLHDARIIVSLDLMIAVKAFVFFKLMRDVFGPIRRWG